MRVEYEKINGSNGYKLSNFVVFDVPNEGIPYNIFNEMGDFLEEGGTIPKFDIDRNLIDNIYSNYVLIEYSDKKIRDNDIKNNSKVNIINPIKSEIIDNDKQLAENVGNFEYNGKFYLVVYPYNALTNETDSKLGIHKGVIINSEAYFGISEDVKKEVEINVDKVDDIVD